MNNQLQDYHNDLFMQQEYCIVWNINITLYKWIY